MNETTEIAVWTPTTPVVSSLEDYHAAADYRAQIHLYIKRVNEYWAKTIKEAFEHHKGLVAKRTAALKPAEENDEQVRKAMDAWFQADQQRRAAEQAALEAAERSRAEEARLADAVALAEHAEAIGDAHMAAAADNLLDFPLEVAPVFVGRSVAKSLPGGATKKRFVVTIDNPRAVILAAVAGAMLDVADAMNPGWPAKDLLIVRRFLATFQPARDALWAVQTDDVAIRQVMGRRRVGFTLAGVTAEEKEGVV